MLLSASSSATTFAALAFVMLAASSGLATDTTMDLVTSLAQDLSAGMAKNVPSIKSPVDTQVDRTVIPLTPTNEATATLTGALLGRRSCGAEPLSMEHLAQQEVQLTYASRIIGAENSSTISGGLGQQSSANSGPLVKQLDIYWHVIQTGPTLSEGNLPRSAIELQIGVLNQRYQNANFRFQLAKVDYTINKSWYNVRQGSAEDSAMRQALHQGGMQNLNVYSARPLGIAGDLIAGYTKMPQFSALDPVTDGSVILHTTLPGGSEPGFNLGLTLVHELGHALGMMHPFANGCNYPGDAIGDTPYQKAAIYTCTPQKTCPGTPGASDPIHNPMGYAPDACMTTFTSMQNIKMRASWYANRYVANR